ncbi:MAG: alpha/beta fold hydrolase [Planctomycetes bacterium]|nr:alpha/beta fold hydrolase [Planctomycetota bacterium]
MEPLTPLLLVPGLGCDQRLWRHALTHLRDVAAPRFVELPDTDRVDAMAREILAEAPPTFALAGLSMGGYVAFEMLRQAPARVVRLALLDTTADLDAPGVSAARQQALLDIAAGRFDAHVESRLPVLLGPAAYADPSIVATTRAMALAVGAARYARQMRAIMSRPDSAATLRAVACPTLVACGQDDALTPPSTHRAMAGAIPHSRLAVLERCGHLAPLEQPLATTAALRGWLTDQ